MPYPGHGLLYPLLLEFYLKYFAGILEASVTVEEGLGIQVCLDCLLERIEHQLVVIPSTDDPGYHRPVV